MRTTKGRWWLRLKDTQLYLDYVKGYSSDYTGLVLTTERDSAAAFTYLVGKDGAMTYKLLLRDKFGMEFEVIEELTVVTERVLNTNPSKCEFDELL